jgi:hypothetical protein
MLNDLLIVKERMLFSSFIFGYKAIFIFYSTFDLAQNQLSQTIVKIKFKFHKTIAGESGVTCFEF